MPKTTKYADIENHLNNFRAKLIWTYKLTDIYESKELGDYASWTFKFNICALDKTLSAKDIEIIFKEQKDKFTYYSIELCQREEYLNKFLTKEEHKVYEIFLSSNNFNMEDFIDYLNRLIELNDPTITVLVPNKNINYDYIDKRIKTKVSDSIYKGIKILYRNKIYDFSLNEGNA